jgi:hypothetical protein
LIATTTVRSWRVLVKAVLLLLLLLLLLGAGG